jgi:hypothetical protein
MREEQTENSKVVAFGVLWVKKSEVKQEKVK